jgi:hypothetical protein
MVEVVNYKQSFAPVAMIDSIHVMLNIGDSQGKQAYILNIRNAFQNTIEFDPSKRTYNTVPPFFVEYIRLRWSQHPELTAVEQYPTGFVVQHLCSMQGKKDARQFFYKLISHYLRHFGLHRSISDHGIFIWKQPTSELFLALATDDFIILVDDHVQFIDLKTKFEAMFEVTLQEGANLRFLNLHIIQIPTGISIDQTDHIVETIINPISRLMTLQSFWPPQALLLQTPLSNSALMKPRSILDRLFALSSRNMVAHSSIGMESCYMSRSLLASTFNMLSRGLLATLLLLMQSIFSSWTIPCGICFSFSTRPSCILIGQ